MEGYRTMVEIHFWDKVGKATRRALVGSKTTLIATGHGIEDAINNALSVFERQGVEDDRRQKIHEALSKVTDLTDPIPVQIPGPKEGTSNTLYLLEATPA
jgi:hypothetical protein